MPEAAGDKSALHLICGLPGSGKSTLAKEIAREYNAIRFCPDEWIKTIWKETAETEGNTFRSNIEQLQWELAKSILKQGIDVIIEWGTWWQNEREKLRDEAKSVGAMVRFYYLDAPREVLRERILERNKLEHPREFHIPESEIDEFLDICFLSIEIPGQYELSTYDFVDLRVTQHSQE
ncbi:AAA family ATPase [Pedobacter sp. HMF7647]|uniref:AAA family ATPase n=1 Tax=Hufsiella arboris TaxID=2695275 RepID=A0A7K1Y5P5_9SPHI|nr:AAA family ATPase [Hufsiella arboris]MXV49721.1 AAA family ATPase [Hufsiella arboris]